MSNQRTRIAVTGMGAVTPFGKGVDAFWHACLEGKSGLTPITCFDVEGLAFSRGGQVPDVVVPAGIDRASFLMQMAADEAFADAGLTSGTEAGSTAVVLATNFGGACSGEKLFADMETADPSAASEYYMQSGADRVASELGVTGPRVMLSLSCSSGTAALCHAADLIRLGRADIVVAGGYDALSRFAWSGLSALRAMTKDEIRPFDKERAGTIFSEGAGALVLESMDHARKRGASLHAEMLGGWMNNNAYHLTAPAKEGAGSAMVMKRAIEDAGIAPESIDHIDAHGTGTKYNDVTETQAIKTVFGDHARSLSVTAIKSMTGHLMGAAGSIEAISAIQSIKHGIIAPTINYQTPDPECDLDYVTNAAREANLTTVLCNSAGIGGCNAAVVLRKAGDA
jgi:3-oxoacyl-[acyl-carrier-protein] synthase II